MRWTLVIHKSIHQYNKLNSTWSQKLCHPILKKRITGIVLDIDASKIFKTEKRKKETIQSRKIPKLQCYNSPRVLDAEENFNI